MKNNLIFKSNLMDDKAINRALKRISHEIIEKNKGVSNIVLVGIKTRGKPISKRIQENILKFEKVSVPLESIDITLYRDDLEEDYEYPNISSRKIGTSIKDKHVILIDDVIYTGRTARAALDAVTSNGRPKTIQLATLIDRGHRELPIRPDFVGKNIPTSKKEIVKVSLTETDGKDSVDIYEK